MKIREEKERSIQYTQPSQIKITNIITIIQTDNYECII